MSDTSNPQGLPEILEQLLNDNDFLTSVFFTVGKYAKSKLTEVNTHLIEEAIGEDEKPDIQLGANSYIYSGEADARNGLRQQIRTNMKSKGLLL